MKVLPFIMLIVQITVARSYVLNSIPNVRGSALAVNFNSDGNTYAVTYKDKIQLHKISSDQQHLCRSATLACLLGRTAEIAHANLTSSFS